MVTRLAVKEINDSQRQEEDDVDRLVAHVRYTKSRHRHLSRGDRSLRRGPNTSCWICTGQTFDASLRVRRDQKRTRHQRYFAES